MAFQEFGEELRQLRIEKALTVDDVARRIKIPGRTLQDFENGTQSTLHPVYCRGFTKAYAEFLGMDKARLEAALDELYPPEDEDYDSPVLVPPKRRQLLTPGRLAIVILLMFIAAGGWYVHTHGWPELSWLSNLTEIINSSDTPAEEAAPDAAQSQAQPGTPPNAAQTATTPPDAASDAPPGQAPYNAASITPAPEDLLPPVQANSTIAPEPADTASGPHRLVIATSSHDCWTESKVDDEEKRTVYLKSGQTHILTFEHSLTLRLGNVTGLKLRLDGEPYEIPEGRGSTRDLFFGRAADNAAAANGNSAQ